MTLREQFIAALTKRGEIKVKETFKFVVFTRKEGGQLHWSLWSLALWDHGCDQHSVF
jgi:hypothetical protein